MIFGGGGSVEHTKLGWEVRCFECGVEAGLERGRFSWNGTRDGGGVQPWKFCHPSFVLVVYHLELELELGLTIRNLELGLPHRVLEWRGCMYSTVCT